MYSRIIPGRLDRRRGQPRSLFNGNFASLFTPGTVLQSVQSDLGITYGGTMLATGTAPPVITLTGALTGITTAITITDTAPGILGTWTGLVTYGDGSTQAFTSAATVALTGKGAGLTLNIAAGAALGDNVWKATCAAMTDQSGSGVHALQGTASAQPLVTTGVNGVAGIGFDGVNMFLGYTLALPAAGTTPTFFWGVWRFRSIQASNMAFFGDISGGALQVYLPISSTAPQQFNGSVANSNAGGPGVGAWGRLESLFSNSAADYVKWGASTVTGANAGNAAPNANRRIADANGGNKLDMELLAFVIANAKPSTAQLAALGAAVTAKYGATVQV